MQDGVATPIAMPSHDIGAVGMVKRLIDHTAGGTVRSRSLRPLVRYWTSRR
jgi:hypothetical protein